MLRKTLALMLVLLLLPCATLGDTLQVDFQCLNEEAEAAFLADHPGTSVEYGQFGFINTVNDLNTMLLTGQMKYDIFCETNVYTDYRQTMERGYCLDLSSSEVIRRAIACMYPAIARQLTVDGKIYGLPCEIQFDLLRADEEVFRAMGYDESDVPKTCGDFLSFLEAWVVRQETEPESVQVFGAWDYTVYDETTYTVELSRLILEEAIRQQQAAGQALDFSDPSLEEALTRTRQIGRALSRIEPPSASASDGEWRDNQPALFDRYSMNPWGTMADWGMSLRMSKEQPFTLPVLMRVAMVSAATGQPELALAYMERLAGGGMFISRNEAFFFSDVDFVPAEDFNVTLAYLEQMVGMLEAIPMSPDAPIADLVESSVLNGYYHDNFVYWYNAAHDEEQAEAVEDMLEKYRQQLSHMEDWRYDVSPAQVQDYRACVDSLSFPVPSVFTPGSSQAQTFLTLLARFASGQLDAAHLLRELDRLAQMAALEAQ